MRMVNEDNEGIYNIIWMIKEERVLGGGARFSSLTV
jgi:hypothetical protein